MKTEFPRIDLSSLDTATRKIVLDNLMFAYGRREDMIKYVCNTAKTCVPADYKQSVTDVFECAIIEHYDIPNELVPLYHDWAGWAGILAALTIRLVLDKNPIIMTPKFASVVEDIATGNIDDTHFRHNVLWGDLESFHAAYLGKDVDPEQDSFRKRWVREILESNGVEL